MAATPRPYVFLDRDGTLNVDRGYVHRWDDWEFLGGVIEALERFRNRGFGLVVVTNQSGVARGLYGEDDVRVLHSQVNRWLRCRGIAIDAFRYCPHGPDVQCGCRKPATGMVANWVAETGAVPDYSRSWTIGDRLTDIEFGKALGTRTVLLAPTPPNTRNADTTPDFVCRDLCDAADIIFRHGPPLESRDA